MAHLGKACGKCDGERGLLHPALWINNPMTFIVFPYLSLHGKVIIGKTVFAVSWRQQYPHDDSPKRMRYTDRISTFEQRESDMTTMQHPVENAARDAPAKPADTTDTVEWRRARRMAALRKVSGMWASRKDIPADGLEYQREMRAEWR